MKRRPGQRARARSTSRSTRRSSRPARAADGVPVMPSRPAAEAGASAPALPVPDHRRAEAEGGLAAQAARPRADEPVDRRLHRLPRSIRSCMNGYLSFTHYDLLNPPRWIGLANYRYAFGERPGPLAGDQEHALDHRRSASRSRCSSPSASPRCSPARRTGRRLLPHRLLPAGARAAGRRHAGLRLHPQSGDRPDQHGARPPRDRGAALVQRPRLGEAVARPARRCGGSATS